MSRFKAIIYTKGKFSNKTRKTLDTYNEYLYSYGIYPTKIKETDLPEDYIQIQSRSIWYMIGYLKTSGIVDIQYRYVKNNHLFKDDFIYISYKEKLLKEKDTWGFEDYVNYDVCISGNDIIPIALAAEKYSNIDITHIRKGVEEKRKWYKENCFDDYQREFGNEDVDLFEIWMED